MSKLVKIAPIIVILAAAGSLFFVFKLDRIKKDQQAQIASLGNDLTSTKGNLQKSEAAVAAAKKTLATTSNTLTQTIAELQTTKTALEQMTQEASGLKTQVAERDTQLQARAAESAAARQELDRIVQVLKDIGIEGITNIGQIRARIQAMGDENKVLTDGLAKARDENQKLKDQIVDLSTTPANTRGRVADVQDKWGFLVLDIGEQQHVRKNTQFLVYRDKKPVASVKVLYVGPNASVAEMLPGSRLGIPRVGDIAVH